MSSFVHHCSSFLVFCRRLCFVVACRLSLFVIVCRRFLFVIDGRGHRAIGVYVLHLLVSFLSHKTAIEGFLLAVACFFPVVWSGFS